MRSLHDSIEYRDEKRQKTITDTLFQFRDFSSEALIPPRHGKKENVAGVKATFIQEEVLPEEILIDPAAHVGEAEEEARRVLDEAEKKAHAALMKASDSVDKLMAMARERAEAIEKEAREEGFRLGYEEGKQRGAADGKEEGYREMAEKYSQFFAGLDTAMKTLDSQKQQRLQAYADEMKELVLVIAKKVIHVSLDTSGEVIKQMILTAAENGRDKQWSRVFISGVDAARMKQDGIDINHLVQSFSDRIKIIVNEDAAPGSCVVEFPDQIIDAGVDTQLRNIKDMIDDFTDGAESEVRFALS